MSDEFKNKSGKVRVMYVRGDTDNQPGGINPRTGKGKRPDTREKKGKSPGGSEQGRSRRFDKESHPDSPWRTISRRPEDPDKMDHGGISGKSAIDPEQLRRQRMEETRVYGENACQALFLNRPESIVRAWFEQEVTPRFREALRWMAANRKAYHVVDESELNKASGTEHHGGVCFLIKKRRGTTVSDWLEKKHTQDCVLALENIGNPHNLGAIMRSCAHFGVQGVLTAEPSMLESGAAVRTAEGGAEKVQAITSDFFSEELAEFRRAGYTIVTTSSHQGEPLSNSKLPAKMVLVIGQERTGISDSVLKQGDLRVSIDGTGHVESLNVSVAAGILLSEWWRQNH